MDKISFAPLIDIPLVGITLAVFIGHFNRWALRKDVDTSFNLASRLPRARIRVVAFFACILLVCWYGNLAVWSIVAILLGVGLVLCHSLKLGYDGLLVRRQILAPTDWKSIVQVSTQL